MPGKNPLPGFYQDPEDPARMRLWTGKEWADEWLEMPAPPSGKPVEPSLPGPSASKPLQRSDTRNGYITAGLVFAILGLVPLIATAFSIIAITIGLIGRRRASRGVDLEEKRRATWVLGLGILGASLSLLIIAAANILG